MKISSQRYVSVSTSSASFLEAIPNRVGLIISAPTTDILLLSLTKVASAVAPDQSGGIALHPGADPLILTAQEHGDLPSRGWSAIMLGGAGEDINVVETFSKG